MQAGPTASFSEARVLLTSHQPLLHAGDLRGDGQGFQVWLQDENPALTSNLTDASSVLFR